jgi:chromosome segregation ATPase
MSVATFLDKFVGLQQKKARATTASYRDLVAAIATGEEPEPVEVEQVLNAADKSVDDLRHDVDRYEHRMALKALVASMPKLEAEQQELRRQVAKADDALADAEQHHNEVTAPLYSRLERISMTLSEAEDAKRELYYTCDDPSLHNELDALNSEAERLSMQQRALTDRSTFMEEKSRIERERANRELGEGAVEGRQDLADRYHADAEVARRDAKQLERTLADLDNRREQLEEQMRQA